MCGLKWNVPAKMGKRKNGRLDHFHPYMHTTLHRHQPHPLWDYAKRSRGDGILLDETRCTLFQRLWNIGWNIFKPTLRLYVLFQSTTSNPCASQLIACCGQPMNHKTTLCIGGDCFLHLPKALWTTWHCKGQNGTFNWVGVIATEH